MLSVDIRSSDGRAVELEGSIAPEDAAWLDGDIRLSSPVTVHGRLSNAGEGRYYCTGEVRGTASGECTRCLTEYPTAAHAGQARVSQGRGVVARRGPIATG